MKNVVLIIAPDKYISNVFLPKNKNRSLIPNFENKVQFMSERKGTPDKLTRITCQYYFHMDMYPVSIVGCLFGGCGC